MKQADEKQVLLLFSRAAVVKNMAVPEELIRLLNDASDGISYEHAYYEDLIQIIDNEKPHIFDVATGKGLEEYDLVYHRRWGDAPDIAMSAAIYLQKKGIKQIDREILRQGSISKLTQYWRLYESGLPFPSTIYVPRAHLKDWIKKSLDEYFELPMVMKSTRGTRGQDNYLAGSMEEAVKIFEDNPDKEFLLQRFVPNDEDYRVIVCGEEIALVIKRTAQEGSYKNNTSLGGAADLIDKEELPKSIQKACIKAARGFSRDIAGVDVVIDKDNPDDFYFFEVNRAPQIEKSSFGEDKARAVNRYFKELLR
jgi:glutathione synthase/RimK-type ligase-like ATP-grasp enzyme